MALGIMTDHPATHIPVLLNEAIDLLNVKPGGVLVDCTVGLAGHSEEILTRLQGTGELIGLDRDAEALSLARERLGNRFDNFSLYNENFKNLPLLIEGLGLNQIDGCLIDQGVSSLQLDRSDRGFSFQREGPLDMRMDKRGLVTAGQIVNRASETELVRIFKEYGEERQARKIAEAIVNKRRVTELRTTTELADLVQAVKGPRRTRIHAATKVFQALRMEVNQELNGLEELLNDAILLLRPGGRLVTISFQSHEDRVCKRTFRLAAGKCICFRPADLCTCPKKKRVRILTPKPVTPSEQESRENPRSRSAKLRAAERIKKTT